MYSLQVAFGNEYFTYREFQLVSVLYKRECMISTININNGLQNLPMSIKKLYITLSNIDI
jgi:maltoporin